MDFRIADTFTDSLARLTGEEQKAVKTTAFDLQLNPASPGMNFHRLEKAKDKNFCSVRVNSDIRLIVHRSDTSLLLCYVGHHDKAYEWAERRRLETHPKTGAAQMVVLRETIQEIVVPVYVENAVAPAPKIAAPSFLFPAFSDEDLLGYGVPSEWLADVRQATAETIFVLAEQLPAEAAEALLELATGGIPRISQSVPEAVNPFDHPDALRRFRIMTNVEELARAFDYPWDKWTVFLHPEQRQWVERDYNGPARVSGSAGTGKTIVALHRAAHLARANPDSRVLLTTFSDALATALHIKLRRLLSSEPRLAERIDVYSLDAVGSRLYRNIDRQGKLASAAVVRDLVAQTAHATPGHNFGMPFLLSEWEQVVDAWQLETWESYRDVARLGRKTRLPEAQRLVLWEIYERVRSGLTGAGLITSAGLFTRLAATPTSSFDFAVVDEAQDLSIAHLRFLAALGGGRPNALFFAGDTGQRIFQQPCSWKALGIDIRGRSRTLRVNYRTSHQIRVQADRLLGPAITDADGNTEDRSDTVSVFNGVLPRLHTATDESAEIQTIANWIAELSDAGVSADEFGVFVRSSAELDRAIAAVEAGGLPYAVLDESGAKSGSGVTVGTMHLAKGLEFRAVVVMACDDEVLPLQARIETAGEETDLQEVYTTERHLLYVACTRARDYLMVSGVAPVSEFLDDLTC